MGFLLLAVSSSSSSLLLCVGSVPHQAVSADEQLARADFLERLAVGPHGLAALPASRLGGSVADLGDTPRRDQPLAPRARSPASSAWGSRATMPSRASRSASRSRGRAAA